MQGKVAGLTGNLKIGTNHIVDKIVDHAFLYLIFHTNELEPSLIFKLFSFEKFENILMVYKNQQLKLVVMLLLYLTCDSF